MADDHIAHDNTAATLAIPAGLKPVGAAHWLPVHVSGLKGSVLKGLSAAELGPFAPGRVAAAGDEATAAAAGPAAAGPAAAAAPQDDAQGSDQQQQQQQQQHRAGSAPATAALKATLRGRALAGACWPLPPGVGGLVLEPAPELDVAAEEEEDEMDDDDDEYGQQRRPRSAGGAAVTGGPPRQRSWRAVAAFDQLVSWNHDTAPAPTDAAWRLMDFLAVSAAAHAGPAITREEVEAEVKRVEGGGGGDAPAAAT